MQASTANDPVGRAIKYALQPTLLVIVIVGWLTYGENVWVYPLAAVGVQLILGFLEHWKPARRDWLQAAREKTALVVLALVIYAVAGLIGGLYENLFRAPLADIRIAIGLDIWPSHWPLLIQLFLAFFLSEFIWYWFHRAEHRWQWVWRLSGHGAHHAFKHLGAINSSANHPLEMFVILVPSMLVELLFGAGFAAAGAGALTVLLAAVAHTNLDLNTKVIGWLFTVNRYHIHHHSIIMEQSNTNYGCSAIIWDRVFGTFADADTAETGIGPSEPSMWEKFMMPVREPEDTQIAPN